MKSLYAILMLLGATGCANLKSDYVAPASGPTATVDVGDVADVINRRVLVHGADICNFEQTRLVGIVKSKAIGVETVERHVITVEANKQVAISMPWARPRIEGTMVKTEYCQPVAVFTPAEGRRYKLDFASCSAVLSDDRGASGAAAIYRGCDLAEPKDDPRRERMFFLVPKK